MGKPTSSCRVLDREEVALDNLAHMLVIGRRRSSPRAAREALHDRRRGLRPTTAHTGAQKDNLLAFCAAVPARQRLRYRGRERALSVTTLVIHGDEDSLIHIGGGRDTHNATIPDSQWLTYPDDAAYDGVHGMGHDNVRLVHRAVRLASVQAPWMHRMVEGA
jgi:pimeloyl-ACP methyl ester carboxylesterase